MGTERHYRGFDARQLLRFPDWEPRLAEYFTRAFRLRFKYGTFDCCTFAAGAVEAITGVNLMADIRYKNRSEARLVMPRGLADAFVPVMQANGVECVSVGFGRRGDLVLASVPNHPAIGVVGLDGKHALFATRFGVARLPLSECSLAWRIG
jgi:hypothetical protein